MSTVGVAAGRDSSVRRFLDLLYQSAAALAGACVVSIFVLMIVSSLLREVGSKTAGVTEVVAWLTASAAFLGLAGTFKRGDLIRVELLLTHLPPRLRRAFELMALLGATVITAYIAAVASMYVLETYRFGDVSTGQIVLPLWIPQSTFVVGTAVFLISVCDELLSVLRGKRPSYAVEAERRFAANDFAETV